MVEYVYYSTMKKTPLNRLFLVRAKNYCPKSLIQKEKSGSSKMPIAVKLSDALVADAKATAAMEHRSVPRQIEYWARIGKTALEKPDLPLQMVLATLLSREEAKDAKLVPHPLGKTDLNALQTLKRP